MSSVAKNGNPVASEIEVLGAKFKKARPCPFKFEGTAFSVEEEQTQRFLSSLTDAVFDGWTSGLLICLKYACIQM
jgi:hypothetical protein